MEISRKPILHIYGYIYLTTNLVNDKKYIGQHQYSKPCIDPHYLGSGVAFTEAVNKYGKENSVVEVLDWAESPQELDYLEKLYIACYGAVRSSNFYNTAFGDELRSGLTEEELARWRQKISEAQKGPKNHQWGKQVPDDVKEKIRQSTLGPKNHNWGMVLSPERRELLRRVNTGREPSNKGVKMPPELLEQHTQAMRALASDPNWIAKNAAHLKRLNQSEVAIHTREQLAISRRQPVIQLSLDGEIIRQYVSGAEAGRATGYAKGNISKCCRGEIPTAYGYKWVYSKDFQRTPIILDKRGR